MADRIDTPGPGSTAGRLLDKSVNVAIIAACCAICWSVFVGNRAPSTTPAVGTPSPAARAQARPAQQRPLPKEPLSIASANLRGSTKAKIAVVEYSDFQCPFCARFAADTLPQLLKAFVDKGEVLWAFNHLPLDAIHNQALDAANASECAARQGKFWEMHDRLFLSQKMLDRPSLQNYAGGLGLNQAEFATCIADPGTSGKVRNDLQRARAMGLDGTPSFLIGLLHADGQVEVKSQLVGAQPFERFKTEFEKLAGTGSD